MRVLIVEDEPDLQRVVWTCLQEEGYVVDAASDGEEGLYKAANWDYDAIILDVMLPKLDGWQVLGRLRKLKPTPVLMLTARDAVQDRVKGLDSGADDDEQRGSAEEERHGEPEEAVGPHLEQDARQDHAAGGRRLDVGVGQPGVEREERHLDREAGEEQEEDEHLRTQVEGLDLVPIRRRERGEPAPFTPGVEVTPRGPIQHGLVVQELRQFRDRERENILGRTVVGDHHQADHADQREQAPHERIQEKGDRGTAPFGSAVKADQEKERDQREFEEDVEKDDIQT